MSQQTVSPAMLAVVCAAALVGCDFFTDETTHCPPHGAIGARYIAIGGEDGSLGRCTGQETGRDGGQAQDFANGAMYWTERTGAWEVWSDRGEVRRPRRPHLCGRLAGRW